MQLLRGYIYSNVEAAVGRKMSPTPSMRLHQPPTALKNRPENPQSPSSRGERTEELRKKNLRRTECRSGGDNRDKISEVNKMAAPASFWQSEEADLEWVSTTESSAANPLVDAMRC